MTTKDHTFEELLHERVGTASYHLERIEGVLSEDTSMFTAREHTFYAEVTRGMMKLLASLKAKQKGD
jgi:hypothetical protein